MTKIAPVLLGNVTLPSGVVAIYDVGVTAFVLSGQIPELPTVRVAGLPADRALDVFGVATDDDEAYNDGWDHVVIRVDEGAVASSAHVGDVIVDFARIMFIDDQARGAWQHNDPIDGLADFVFWGRDATTLADVVNAPMVTPGSYGWLNLAVDDAVAKGKNAERERHERGLLLAADFRPTTFRPSRPFARASTRPAASTSAAPAPCCG